MTTATLDPTVKETFQGYPPAARKQLKLIRSLIFDAAEHLKVKSLVETLKWGEPAYLHKKGSTVRIAWNPKYPDRVSVYFICSTILVETFREIYPDLFEYDGKRAIHLPIDRGIPVAQLSHCLSLALDYHNIKHLPLLGA